MKTLLTGIAMGESPRWHDGRLWFSDWGAQAEVATERTGQILTIEAPSPHAGWP